MELTNLAQLRPLLEKHHLLAQKKFGQNFLTNKNVLQKIIQTADIQPSDTIIEIGPGPGVLTRELCQKAGKVLTVEKDRNIIPLLRETTSEFQNLEILEQDALKFKPSKKLYKLVANLPYNVATPLLRNFLMSENRPDLIVVLTQLEVAQKASAQKGDMNVLALTIQPFGKPEIIAKVSPQSFFPAPKVTSAILKIEPYKTPLLSRELEEKYFDIIHRAFQQKRKQLKRIVDEEILTSLHLRPDIRPQDISLEEWLEIAEKY